MALHNRRPVIFITVFLLSAFSAFPVFAFDVQGQISISGPAPELKPIQVKNKPEESFPDEVDSPKLIVSPDGLLKNAVISIEDESLKGTAFPGEGPFVLNQEGYHFEPHVLVVPVGAAIEVVNSDAMDHDVRAFDGDAIMQFRYGMSANEHIEVKLDTPGLHVIRCGFHKWMHALVISAEHPYYAVTDDQGKFQLRDVPKGRYNLRIWHELLGEAEMPLEVTESIDNFSYSFKPELNN